MDLLMKRICESSRCAWGVRRAEHGVARRRGAAVWAVAGSVWLAAARLVLGVVAFLLLPLEVRRGSGADLLAAGGGRREKTSEWMSLADGTEPERPRPFVSWSRKRGKAEGQRSDGCGFIAGRHERTYSARPGVASGRGGIRRRERRSGYVCRDRRQVVE